MASPIPPNTSDHLHLPSKVQADHSASVKKIIQNAKSATGKEQKMSLLQGIKLYPKAVAWSVLISTCITMEGYDISLVNNFYGFPAFNKKYGKQMADGTYQVSAPVRHISRLYYFFCGLEIMSRMPNNAWVTVASRP